MRGKDTGDVSVVYAYSIEGKAHKGLVKMAATPPVPGLQPNLPPDCATLTAIAKAHAEDSYAESGLKVRIVTAAVSDPAAGEATITPRSAEAALRGAGIPERKFSNRRTAGWFKCPAARLKEILYPETAAGTGETDETPEDIIEETPDTGVQADAGTKRVVGHPGNTHKPADAMDWDEALEAGDTLIEEGKPIEAMLIIAGCFLGLRISDLLRLKWGDLRDGGLITLRERKTRKSRKMRVNPYLAARARKCMELAGGEPDGLVFQSREMNPGVPITRQRAGQMLKETKRRLGITSAENLSTHSLRKTFGRKVWLTECERGMGDQALVLLCDVFGHSSVAITKRYLGIRQEEILSVYDKLEETKK